MSLLRQCGFRAYPGDTPVNQEVRHAINQQLAKRLPKAGHILTLAGPDAAEVPYLKNLIRACPTKTWFVDIREEGLQKARRLWSGVQTFHGPIEHILLSDAIPCVRFAHLDFMGLYTLTVARSVKALGPKLVDGGIVAITFMRGRENSPNNLRARHLAACIGLPGSTQDAREIQRWTGTFMALQEDLNRDLVLLDGVAYRHHQSAMGALIVQAK